MILRHCGNCIHYLPGERDQGVCRRHPPSVVMIPQPNLLTGNVEMNTASSWPPVLNSHWCGEFSEQPLSRNRGAVLEAEKLN